MTQTIEQLTARVRELEEENARLKKFWGDATECAAIGITENDELKTQLAASQLHAEQLRVAIEDAVDRLRNTENWLWEDLAQVLTLPRDTSALDAYVAEKVKEVIKEADDQILAAKNLLAIMHRDGGHHEFAVGFDQAIQDAMAVYYELTRQRDLAVEALKWAADVLPPIDPGELGVCVCPVCRALSTIKESEAK